MTVTKILQETFAGEIFGLDASQDSKTVLIALEKQMLVWHPEAERPLQQVPYSSSVRAVAITPDGKHVAASMVTSDSFVQIWRTADICNASPGKITEQSPRVKASTTPSAAQTLECHSDVVIALRYLADGRRIACASHAAELSICDAESGVMKQQWESTRPANDVVCSPNQKWIAYGTGHREGRLIVRAIDSGKEKLNAPNKQGGAVRCVDFSPDSRNIVAGCGDGHLRRWGLTRKAPLFSVNINRGIRSVHYLDAQNIAVAQTDGSVSIHDSETGSPRWKWQAHKDVVKQVIVRNGIVMTSCYNETSSDVCIWQINR